MKHHNWTDNMNLGSCRRTATGHARDVLGLTQEQRAHREYIRRKVALVSDLQQL